jgi:Cysteine-rich CPCC
VRRGEAGRKRHVVNSMRVDGAVRDGGRLRSQMAWLCPACGYRTLPVASPGGGARCAVCGWQDVGEVGFWQEVEPWEPVDLDTARRNVWACGACDPSAVGEVRAPSSEEARPAWWRPVEEGRVSLIEAFTAAFAGVRLSGGTSLSEAERRDFGGGELLPPPLGTWEGLTEDDLGVAPSGPFVFMDARGLRFYTPAFAVWELRHGTAPNTVDFLFGGLGAVRADCAALFDVPQRRVVAEWMFWHAWWRPVGHETFALRSLRNGWAGELDAERQALLTREWARLRR